MHLAPYIDLQLKKNRRQHVLADELMIKIQRFKDCFPWGSLPLPTEKVTTAWKGLPNITMSNLSVAMKTGLVFLRAPPPSPTGFALDAEGPMTSDLYSNTQDDDSWLFVDDATLAMSDAVVPWTLEDSTTSDSEDDWKPRRGCSDQPLDRRTDEEDPLQAGDSNSSDRDSLSASSGDSPMPVGFDNMVNQWLLDYRTRGTDAFIESLFAFGVISVGTALQASRIARAMVKKVAKVSYMEGRSLENAIRFTALEAFKRFWDVSGTSAEVTFAQAHATPPSPYGINIASLMGGLFEEKMSTAKDIQLCLGLLLEGEKRFDRLCAMHALLVQANDKLCKNRNLPALMQFRDGITCVDKDSGEYLWATAPHSKMILTDILRLIERWLVSQAIKREESRMSSGTGHRTIRNSAVGPRLRNHDGY